MGNKVQYLLHGKSQEENPHPKEDWTVDEEPYIRTMMLDAADLPDFPDDKVTKILDFLYLGNEDDARDHQTLLDLHITHVINCAEDYNPLSTIDYYTQRNIAYLGFAAEDRDWYQIFEHFEQVYDVIERARVGSSNGKVLIHCKAGVNRSGALAVGYLMLHCNIGPITATKYVTSKRRKVMSNEGFRKQLVNFANKRNLLTLDQKEVTWFYANKDRG